jgi:hypothetical protein
LSSLSKNYLERFNPGRRPSSDVPKKFVVDGIRVEAVNAGLDQVLKADGHVVLEKVAAFGKDPCARQHFDGFRDEKVSGPGVNVTIF